MNYPILKDRSKLLISVICIITGILIGLLITAQFKSSIPTSSYIYDELAAQKDLIDGYMADQGLLKSKISSLRGQINEAQEKAKSTVKEANLETLKQLKNEIGLESATGAGVMISLDDGLFVDRENAETVSESLVHASDLRDIVNILRTAKVTAIAINDQRIIATTPITSVGNTILVNNFHLMPPFTVTAIGDRDLITQRLQDPSSLPDLMKRSSEMKIQFKMDIKEGLSTPTYNASLSVKYINLPSTAAT